MIDTQDAEDKTWRGIVSHSILKNRSHDVIGPYRVSPALLRIQVFPVEEAGYVGSLNQC